MNTLLLGLLLAFSYSVSTVIAQNDTMYVMKSGAIVGKYNVNNQVDSVIFYNPSIGSSNTVTDYDGNVYTTVTIGTQIWMAENLKTTHYANGTAIPLVTGNSNWYGDDIANKATYGALYTWAAAMNGAASVTANPSGVQGVCPTGWHLPSDAEWSQMENYLADNGHNYDGTTGGRRNKIAKSLASTSGWIVSITTGAVGNTDYPTFRNKSGFTALPGGNRYSNGSFDNIGFNGYWWSATEYYATFALHRNMNGTNSDVIRHYSSKEVGFSVRCVRDDITNFQEYLSIHNQMLIVYPNLVDDKVNIDLRGMNEAEGRLCILNFEGKTLLSRQVNNEGVLSLDISHLSAGIYFCRYSTNSDIKTVKIIKQ